MKPRTIQMLFGVLVLSLALLACNLPGNSAAPSPTAPEVPPAVSTDTPAGTCPAVNLAPNPSGLVSGVTMAEGTSGDNKDPVNPTNSFGISATFHAVVSLKDAPSNTNVKAIWYATDTAGAAECNTQIDEYELTTDGTRNVDFSLTPQSTWPAGSFRVEVFINGTLDQAITFSVK
jgi:hypothetical protein